MDTSLPQQRKVALLGIPVIVAALGYFVDIYDLLLFSIIRVKSLQGIGLEGELLKSEGQLILSIQMAGLLIGGILWGIMGDKKGRLSVLFGSILLYSLANISNGFVQTVTEYKIARFIAGIGLAGELGAGITLVSELISKEKRGIATSIVAGIGLTGAIVAYFISKVFDWRTCYFIGGGLGFLLLVLRISVFESGMYKGIQRKSIKKGNVLMFFNDSKRFKKYLLAILIGLPTWYVIGVLLTFTKEFGVHFGIVEPIDSGKAVMMAYIMISIGDLLIGFISNWFKSRKKALYFYYALTIIGIFIFFSQNNQTTANTMYYICMYLGFATGFWALFVTMAAEHFGTNLRATAATTVPNMVRGATGILLFFSEQLEKSYGFITGREIVGVVVMVISIIAVIMTEETFGKDLNFVEE